MNFKSLRTFLSASILFASVVADARPTVILISIDGLGSRLLSSLSPNEVPNLTALARDGGEAVRAETIALAKTIPAHASMLSGVDTPKHGRTYNDFDADLKKMEAPTIFDLAKLGGLTSAAIFGKDKLSFLFDTGALSHNEIPRLWPFGDWYARIPRVIDHRAIRILRDEKPDLLFIHYALVDSVGHIFGWETSPQQMAVKSVDSSLGRLRAFLDSGAFENPDGYFILLTADHGGHGPSHGQGSPTGELESPETDLVIPWMIYRSPTANSASVKFELQDARTTVKIYDTAATAAAVLGLTIPSGWQWDGVNRLKPF